MSLTKATYSMIDGAPVNIRDYGADPTGVADSTAAIQAAIAASSGVVVGSPGDTYLMTSITITKDVVIDAQGSTFKATALSNVTFICQARVFFANAVFDNVNLAWSAGATSGGVSGSKFINPTYNQTGAISGASNILIENNYFTGKATGPLGSATYPCCQITTGAHNISFINNYCYDVEAGVTNDGISSDTYNILVEGNYFDTLTQYAVKNDVSRDVIVRNNNISNTVYGVFQQVCYNTTISSNKFDTCTEAAMYNAQVNLQTGVWFNSNEITNTPTGVLRGLCYGTIIGNQMTGGYSLVSPLISGGVVGTMATFLMLNLEIANNFCDSQVNNPYAILDNEAVACQGVIVVTNTDGSSVSKSGQVSIHDNVIVNYYGNAIQSPRLSTAQGNNINIYNNSFYAGASSVNAVNLSAVKNLRITGNTLDGTASTGHSWNATNRVYGNVIVQENSWQYVASAPAADNHVKGEVWTNTTFTAGGYSGWLCITSGNPGTFKGYGAIEA
jgi:hypothetical protein